MVEIVGSELPGGTRGRGRAGRARYGVKVRAWTAGFAVLAAVIVPVTAATTAVAQPDNPNEYLYIANSERATLTVSDLNDLVIDGIANVGSEPTGVAVNQAGTRAYSANAGSHSVSVINADTDLSVATVQVGQRPQNLALTPDGRHVYVTNLESDTVSVIDTATNSVTSTVAVGQDPFGVAIAQTSNGPRAYVSEESGHVTVIDTNATPPAVVDTIDVMQAPENVAVSADGSKAYVVGLANAGLGQVMMINTANNTVETRLDLPGSTPWGVATNPTGGSLYVTDTDNGNVLVIDPAISTVTSTVSLGANTSPFGVTYSNDGNYVYVAQNGTDDVAVIAATLSPPQISEYIGSDSHFIHGPMGLAAGPIPAKTQPTDLTVTVLEDEDKGPRVARNPGALTLRAHLTSEEGPLRDKVVHFTSDSSPTWRCADLTDRRGMATCTIPAPRRKPACHSATFNGLGHHQPATATTCPHGTEGGGRSTGGPGKR